MSKWEWKEFEDCIEHVKYTTKIPSKDYLQEGEFPIVSQEDCLISGYWNDKNDLFKVTKPIVIFGDHTKVLKYIDFDFVLGADGVKILCPRDFLDAHFFFYFLKSVNFDNLGYARHYGLLKELSVPIPSLSEQNRIVKFLDEEFSKIDTLKTNAETNLKNAKELFEASLEKELNPRSRHSERSEESSAELPSGWEWVALNNVCKKIFAGGDKPQNCSKKSNEILSVPVYANAIENEGLYGYTDKAVVKEPCLTISARGTIGFTVKRTEPFVPIIRLIVLIPKIDVIDLDYFFFSVKHLKIVGNGTSIPQLTVPLVKQYTIPLPPLSVQKEIVARLDKLSDNVKRLEANYKQIIADCDELKKSILKKTFEEES